MLMPGQRGVRGLCTLQEPGHFGFNGELARINNRTSVGAALLKAVEKKRLDRGTRAINVVRR